MNMEQDLAILQNISDTLKIEPEASQRQLAQNASISIGLMNAILKRFVERGWIMLTNVNGRKLAYAVTPQGINELYKRGKTFTTRTFAAANAYNEIILKLVQSAKESDRKSVRLYGNSNIKFLLNYVCNKLKIDFEECDLNMPVEQDSLCLIGELTDENYVSILKNKGCINLIEVLM